jgi:hypothetical protein
VEQSRSAAPVSAHAEIEIAAEERVVWAIIADIAAWPSWDHAVRQVSFDAELENGAAFHCTSTLGQMSCRLTRVDAPRELAWRGRAWLLTLQQACGIEPGVTGSHVRVEASLSGLVARLFRRRLQARLGDELDSFTRLLKLEAEMRSFEERAETARAEATEAGRDSDG